MNTCKQITRKGPKVYTAKCPECEEWGKPERLGGKFPVRVAGEAVCRSCGSLFRISEPWGIEVMAEGEWGPLSIEGSSPITFDSFESAAAWAEHRLEAPEWRVRAVLENA
jgi:hypothetical protein